MLIYIPCSVACDTAPALSLQRVPSSSSTIQGVPIVPLLSSVRGLAPETQVGLSRYSVTIKLCDSYCLGIDLDELIARRLSSCAMGGVHVYTIVGFG